MRLVLEEDVVEDWEVVVVEEEEEDGDDGDDDEEEEDEEEEDDGLLPPISFFNISISLILFAAKINSRGRYCFVNGSIENSLKKSESASGVGDEILRILARRKGAKMSKCCG